MECQVFERVLRDGRRAKKSKENTFQSPKVNKSFWFGSAPFNEAILFKKTRYCTYCWNLRPNPTTLFIFIPYIKNPVEKNRSFECRFISGWPHSQREIGTGKLLSETLRAQKTLLAQKLTLKNPGWGQAFTGRFLFHKSGKRTVEEAKVLANVQQRCGARLLQLKWTHITVDRKWMDKYETWPYQSGGKPP